MNNIKTQLVDVNNNKITYDEFRASLRTNSKESNSYTVVYAHADEVNSNGLKLKADSLNLSREKYPVYFEHSDSSVLDTVGYIKPAPVANENGEFVGEITFYDTDAAKHAERLWLDEVLTELSVSYYIEDAEEIDGLDDSTYILVNSAIFKEVSIVSVGADRNTGRIDKVEQIYDDNDDTPDDDSDDTQNDKQDIDESTDDDSINIDSADSDDDKKDDVEELIEELEKLKLKFLKQLV